METRYRIIFRGEVLDGHAREQVMQTAAERLGATIGQVGQMFSGRPAVLKKGLDSTSAQRYVAVLARLGMRASAEPMPDETTAEAPVAAAPAPQPAPAGDDVLAPVTLPATPSPQFVTPPVVERTAGLGEEPFDPERTHVADHVFVTAYGTDSASPVATQAEHSMMPTQIVLPPSKRAPAGTPPATPANANPDHALVATYLDSIQQLAAEVAPPQASVAERGADNTLTEIRPTPQRAMARMTNAGPTPGPATVTPIKPLMPKPARRLPDIPTQLPSSIYGETTIMVDGPESDEPVGRKRADDSTVRMFATALGVAAALALLAWLALH